MQYVHKRMIRLVYKLLNLYSGVFHPVTHGSRVLICDKNGDILLIMPTYNSHYYLPGGGTSKGELYKDTATRELYEETGINHKIENGDFLCVFQNFDHGKNDTVVVFAVKLDKVIPDYKYTSYEIEDAQFFSRDKLPKDLSKGTKIILEKHFKNEACYISDWK